MEIDKDRILEEGEQVFFHDWDTRGTGSGAGTEVVVRVGDEYYAVMSYPGKPIGPYATLWEVVEAIGLQSVNRASIELGCSELSAAELAARLQTDEEPGFTLVINREPWVVEDGRFVPKRD